MFKLLYFSLFLIFLMTKTAIPQSNVYIFANINEEIITNIDIEKEIKYLRFLNKNMSQLSDKKIFDIAKNSLINEKNEMKRAMKTEKNNEKTNEKKHENNN